MPKSIQNMNSAHKEKTEKIFVIDFVKHYNLMDIISQ